MNRLPFLSRLAVILVVFCALFANLDLLLEKSTTFDPNLWGRDRVTMGESRYEKIKEALPGHGTVGYLSNLKAEDIRFDPGFGEYYLAQYALAPLVVIYSSDQPLVIGNFRGSARVLPAGAAQLVLVKDFGKGVILFRREMK